MRKPAIFMTAVMLLAASSALRAQSASDIAGWIGLMTTPVGGLGPSIVVPAADGSALAWRANGHYAHWQFAPDDDNTTTLAVGVSIPMSRGYVTFDVGRSTVKQCSECNAFMVGVEMDVPLTGLSEADSDPTFGIGLEPSLGYMKETSSYADLSALALGVSLPLTMTVPAGAARVVPFVSPGVGFGLLSGGNDSESGERVMLGGGVAMAAGKLQVTAGARKIFIQDGPTLYGVSLSVGL